VSNGKAFPPREDQTELIPPSCVRPRQTLYVYNAKKGLFFGRGLLFLVEEEGSERAFDWVVYPTDDDDDNTHRRITIRRSSSTNTDDDVDGDCEEEEGPCSSLLVLMH
jgi:hypothetical protein